jgi:hypothetical protein
MCELAFILLNLSPGINGAAQLRWLRHEPDCGTRKYRLETYNTWNYTGEKMLNI